MVCCAIDKLGCKPIYFSKKDKFAKKNCKKVYIDKWYLVLSGKLNQCENGYDSKMTEINSCEIQLVYSIWS